MQSTPSILIDGEGKVNDAKIDGEPLEPKCWRTQVDIAEFDGDPLEPKC